MFLPAFLPAALTALAAALGTWGSNAHADVRTAALADLSLEQLRDVVVTTVSRRPETLATAAASVFVISGEEIRRSGATSLPEALRLVPGLHVARADANQYAISARGFNNVLANKMLVLIDGRTVYSPLFSGVFWEVQQVVLDDVDRIEVVTGPSTALWGTNAVNGLIHVYTKAVAETQGTAVGGEAGGRQHTVTLRQGGAWGDDAHYRVYAQTQERRHTRKADGTMVRDEADTLQTGFRVDWRRSGTDFTLQGDAYRMEIDQAPSPRRLWGGNVLGRWRRELGAGTEATLQVYAERTDRDMPGALHESLDTVDLVAQYRTVLDERHQVVLGAGYRQSRDDVDNGTQLALLPARKSMRWRRLFAQDQIALAEAVDLTLGASLETNPYTGGEALPSARLAWRIDPGHLAWAALSRAVRAPSRIDREYFQPARPPYAVAGNGSFRSEVSNILELGYRAQPSPALSYALTLFAHRHQRLRGLAPTPAGLIFDNQFEGHSHGLEAWSKWRLHERWSLTGGLTLLRQTLRLEPGKLNFGGTSSLGNDPRHWWTLGSSAELRPDLHWQLDLRRVGALPNPAVPAYTAVDTRLAWRLARHHELALSIENALDPGHAEWGPANNRVEVQRSVSLQWRWSL